MDKKKTSTKTIKKEDKPKKKINTRKLRLAIVTSLLLVIIIAFTLFIQNILAKNKYKSYTEQIQKLGFDTLYNNGDANSLDNVTRLELIKVVMGSLNNRYDIHEIHDIADYEEELYTDYDGQLWALCAIKLNLVDEDAVSIERFNEQVTMYEAIKFLVDATEVYLDQKPDYTGVLNFKNLDNFEIDEQKYLLAAVNFGFLENTDTKLDKDDKIQKGELNKMLVAVIQKYVITQVLPEGVNANLVTDEKLLPENADKYPYIIDSIDKEVYEYEFDTSIYDKVADKKGGSGFKTPLETYKTDYAKSIEATTKNFEQYFDTVLNINYETISVDLFTNLLDDAMGYGMSLYSENIEEYVNYVKENKIVIEGKATPLFPIMYYTGQSYMLRTKIDFKVVSSDTNENILFGDIASYQNVTYNSSNNTYSIYIDTPLVILYKSHILKMDMICIASNILSDNSNIMIQ